MILPQNNKLPISYLAEIFNNTTATYKFYWFVAIFNTLYKRARTRIIFWYTLLILIKRNLWRLSNIIIDAWF